MSPSLPPSEFAHFRFVRDQRGEAVELPTTGTLARSLLVVDSERWGLARLRIYEGAASRQDVLEAFEQEMPRLAAIPSDALVRVVSWGRDGEDLFFADAGAEGEALTDYLARVGGIPVSVAADWVLALDRLFAGSPSDLSSFARFTTLNLQVTVDASGEVRPVFSGVEGWLKPGTQVGERSREWHLAQVFCSLIGGIPIRSFHRDSLPQNFDEALDAATRDSVLRLFDGEEGADAAFLETMGKLGDRSNPDAERTGSEPLAAALPLLPVREWLRAELLASFEGETEFEIPELWEPREEPYAAPGLFRGTESWIQVVPGPLSIPREGWLHQHHEATRRPGLPRRHELRITRVEDRGALTFVGEERPDGIDLRSLLSVVGPLSAEEASSLGEHVESAQRSLEGGAGSCEIWWVPPENVFLRSGADAEGTRRLLERRESPVWLDWQVKLRLHQTMRSLCEGVSLPSVLRPLCEGPKRSDPLLRRAAACLPLLYFLLVGKRFRWHMRVAEQDSDGLGREAADWIEECRLAVHAGELGPSMDFEGVGFFAAFLRDLDAGHGARGLAGIAEQAVPPGGAETVGNETGSVLGPDAGSGDACGADAQADGGSPPSTEGDVADADSASVDPHLATALSETLFEGGLPAREPPRPSAPETRAAPEAEAEAEEQHLKESAVADSPRPSAEVVVGGFDPSDPEPPSTTPLFARFVWPAVFGLVVSLAVGYGLVRWNEDQGNAVPGAPPALPEVAYVPPPPPTVELFLGEAREFMIERGRPEMLSALLDFQSVESRAIVVSRLRSYAESGDAAAIGLLATLDLASGEGFAGAAALLEEAAEAGDLRSQYLLAMMVLVEGVPAVSPEEARSLLEQAAARGHSDARELLAVLLHREGEPQRARKLLEEAARAGHLGSIYQLGLFESARAITPAGIEAGVEPAAAETAAARFAEAAERGEPRAMAALGLCYEAGFGLPPSLTEATRWMKSAALLGEESAILWCEGRRIELPSSSPRASAGP